MNYNFTDRTRKVLALAREEAIGLEHEYIGPEHIVLGLIREGEGVAMAALMELGVDPGEIRERVVQESPPGRGEIALGELPYSGPGRKVLHHAMTAAREMNHSYVGTEHLLLGILAVEEEAGAGVLGALGVTLEKARRGIRVLLGADHPTDFGIEIDDGSDVPIVEQIVARVKEAVMDGRLFPGAGMPDERRLAERLEISTGTVARAYADLERQGVLIPVGDGPPRVAGPGGKAEREGPEALATLLRPIVELARRIGVKAEDLRAAFARTMSEVYEDRP